MTANPWSPPIPIRRTRRSLISGSHRRSSSKEPATGTLPIAAAMNPNSTKYYVLQLSGRLTGTGGRDRNMALAPGIRSRTSRSCSNGNYDPITGAQYTGARSADCRFKLPVSPDGKFVITGNTLTGTITIIRTSDDTLVAMVPCDPGCHGVNFGAKKGGGYYAYVTSKFCQPVDRLGLRC